MRLIRGLRTPLGVRTVAVGDSTGCHWMEPSPGQPRNAWQLWDWGDDSKGARMLASAILFYITGSSKFADEMAARFVNEVMYAFEQNEWVLLEENVQGWCLNRLLIEANFEDDDEGGIYL